MVRGGKKYNKMSEAISKWIKSENESTSVKHWVKNREANLECL